MSQLCLWHDLSNSCWNKTQNSRSCRVSTPRPSQFPTFLKILFGRLFMKMSPHYNGTVNTVLGSSFLNAYYFAACNLKAAKQMQNLSQVTVPRTHSQNANNAAALMRTESNRASHWGWGAIYHVTVITLLLMFRSSVKIPGSYTHKHSVLIWCDMIYDMIYLLTAVGLTPSGSSTVHIYTNNTQNNVKKRNTQNGTYIIIRIHKHNNQNT